VRSVPWDGSPLGYGKRLAAVTAPQVQVMIRHQDDSKSVLVAIEAAEPLENGLGVPRLLGSKVHAASLVARDCHLGCIRTKYTPAAHGAQGHFFARARIGRAATGSAMVLSFLALNSVDSGRRACGNEDEAHRHNDARARMPGCGRGSVGRPQLVDGLDRGTGVSDRVRTRDFRSHSRTSDDREESEH
jgi:hypothetical protein